MYVVWGTSKSEHLSYPVKSFKTKEIAEEMAHIYRQSAAEGDSFWVEKGND